MSLAVRVVGLDARKETSNFEARGVWSYSKEMLGGVVSELEGCESRTFEHVSNC